MAAAAAAAAITTLHQFRRAQLAQTRSTSDSGSSSIQSGFNQRAAKQLTNSLARTRREAAVQSAANLCPSSRGSQHSRAAAVAAAAAERTGCKTAKVLPAPLVATGRRLKANNPDEAQQQRVPPQRSPAKPPTTNSTSNAQQQQQQQHCKSSPTTAVATSGEPARDSKTQASKHRQDNLLRCSWKSSASSLNSIGAGGGRRCVITPSAAKSLLQLNTTTAAAVSSPRQLSHSGRARSRREGGQQQQQQEQRQPQRRQQLERPRQSASSLRLSEGRRGALGAPVTRASSTTRLLANHLERHQIRRCSSPRPSAKTAPPTATLIEQTRQTWSSSLAPRRHPVSAKLSSTQVALLAASVVAAAPKRALSCNQLVARAEQAPKVAKTAPGSAITNSRLRQGALFARRQCQLDSSSIAANSAHIAALRSTAQTTVRHHQLGVGPTNTNSRAPLLVRCNKQQAAHKSTAATTATATRLALTIRGAKVVEVKKTVTTTRTTPIKSVAAAKKISAVGQSLSSSSAESQSSSSTANTPSALVSCKTRDIATAGRPTIGRRRWSSLESSNNDESSPSSSSSTLSSTNSSCLIPSPALDYLVVANATVSELISNKSVGGGGGGGGDDNGCGQEAVAAAHWRERRASSPLQSLEDQRQPHKRQANESSTRQPAGALAQQQQQGKVGTDEIIDDCRTQQRQLHKHHHCASDDGITLIGGGGNPVLESDCFIGQKHEEDERENNRGNHLIGHQLDPSRRLPSGDVDLIDDIVVRQPPVHLDFITSGDVASSNESAEGKDGEPNRLSATSINKQNQQNRDNCQGLSRQDSMVSAIEQYTTPTTATKQALVVGLVEELELTYNNHKDHSYVDELCFSGMPGKSSDASDKSFQESTETTPAAISASFTDKMISTDQSDMKNSVGLQDRQPDNQDLIGLDQEIRPDNSNKSEQHQPLGVLQTVNIDQQLTEQEQPVAAAARESFAGKQIGVQTTTAAAAALTKSVISNQNTHKTDDLIHIKQEPICDFYDLEARPFARGKFAQVKRCIRKDTNKCFAAKCIKKRRRLVDIRHEILLEIEALKLSYRTEFIVKLYEVYETSNEIILILEMADGGELQRVLDDEETISEPLVRKMVRQILEGLVHLHDEQIVHLDIKPQNLLLTKPHPNGDIKLCDFGISRRISGECEIREICGTPDYTAPEVLQYDPISLNTDMWSLGVVTYVLLSGYSPFGSENKQQTFCNITTCSLDFPPELFDGVSGAAIDFVRKLIVLNPSQRLTSRQALGHSWINNQQP